jgi:hypothetical protein
VLGFLFSYAAPVSHESGFRTAENRLLPPEISWSGWRIFVNTGFAVQWISHLKTCPRFIWSTLGTSSFPNYNRTHVRRSPNSRSTFFPSPLPLTSAHVLSNLKYLDEYSGKKVQTQVTGLKSILCGRPGHIPFGGRRFEHV